MKVYDAQEICALFDRGVNVIEWIKHREGAEENSATAILCSYDAQAESYTKALGDSAYRKLKDERRQYLPAIFDELAPDSSLGARIGEAAPLAPIRDCVGRSARPI